MNRKNLRSQVTCLVVLLSCTLCLLGDRPSSASDDSAFREGDLVVTIADGVPVMSERVVRATLSRGTQLLVIGVQEPWIGVKTQGRTPEVSGWIEHRYLRPTQRTAATIDRGAEEAWIDKGNKLIEQAMSSPTRVIHSIRSKDGGMTFLAFPQRVQTDTKSLGEAIGCFDKVIEINPNNTTAWNNRGFALKNMGRLEEAIRCFDKAIKIDPRHASGSWNLKARALRELNRLEESIVCFAEAAKVETDGSNKADYFFSMGLVYVELKKVDEARRAFQQAARLGHSGAESELKKLERNDR